MENNTFVYQYSAERNREVESIRKKYMPQEENKLKTLRRLDCRVQRAGMIEGLCLGIVGALTFGIGTCFMLKVFAGAMGLAVLFMALGVLLMIPAYPVYRLVFRRTRERLTPEIIRLSEEIMKS